MTGQYAMMPVRKGTYFAQAREHQPEVGRFVAGDVIRGRGAMPQTLNQYGYCLGNPLRYVDFNGMEEEEAAYVIILMVLKEWLIGRQSSWHIIN